MQRHPNSGSNIHTNPAIPVTDRPTLAPRRTTSFPSTSNPSTDHVRPASVAADLSSRTPKRSSLPHKYGQEKTSRHKRSASGGNISKSEVEGYGLRRPSSPAYPPSSGIHLESHIRPFMEGMQKMIDQEVPNTRVRSLSHPRSPSPNILALGGKSLQIDQ